MNKRIICLILVVVMLALSLVGCGAYSLADDDLSKYASFGYDNGKAGFLKALQNLIIEEGDFTENEETRADKVYDSIYEALASAASDTETKTEGVIGEHDILYYSYYLTYKDGEKTVYIAPDYMKDGKSIKLQVGKKDATELQKAINEKIAGYDFTDKAYAPVVSGKAVAGQIAYISYILSYDEVVDGKTTTKTFKVNLQRVTLDAADPIHQKLIATKTTDSEGKDVFEGGVEIGVKYKDNSGKIEIAENVGYVINGETVNKNITVTDAKIEFVEDGELLCTFDDNSYVESADKVTFKDIYGNEVDVKGKVVTYHVYAVKYSKVDELNASNIITLIYGDGKKLTEALAKKIIFGLDFADKTEDEQKTALEAFKLVISESETKDFAAAITELNTKLSAFVTKKTALSTAKTNLEKANKALADVTPGDEDAKAAAEKNVNDCKEAVTKAEGELATATSERDGLVSKFVAVKISEKTVEELFTEGYENVTYDELQSEYRAEIKNALALEVMKLIQSKVTVSEYPSDLVDEVYDQLYNNYQYTFYNENYKDSNDKEVTDEKGNKVTYYSYYKGSFRNYLCDVMGTETYKEAREQLRADAQALIKPVLQFSFVASQLDKVYTDEEFEAYEEENTGMKQLLELYYGYNDEQIDEYYRNTRNALQFDKLMNYILETEENKGGNGKVTDTYKNVKFTKN